MLQQFIDKGCVALQFALQYLLNLIQLIANWLVDIIERYRWSDLDRGNRLGLRCLCVRPFAGIVAAGNSAKCAWLTDRSFEISFSWLTLQSVSSKVAALAAAFLVQPNFRYLHRSIDAFAHVVDR